MNDQLSQAYDIDNRRAGSYTRKPGKPIQATDNESAKNFLSRFVDAKRDEAKPNLAAERRDEDRFKVGIGTPFPSPNMTFKNTFTAR